MTDRKRIIGLLALLIASAVLFAFFAACSCEKAESIRRREKHGEAYSAVLTPAPVLRPTPTPVPRTTPRPPETEPPTEAPTEAPTAGPTEEPTPEPTVELAGTWRGKMNIAPLVAAELVNTLGSFDMDLERIEFREMEVDLTLRFNEDGTYSCTADKKQIQRCVDGMIDNNWDLIQRAIIEYAADVYGKDPSEITEEDIFGKGKIIDLMGVRTWSGLKSMAGMLKYMMDTDGIGGEFNCEGSYSVHYNLLTMEGFANYREYVCVEDGGSLRIEPVSPNANDITAKVFPLILTKAD